MGGLAVALDKSPDLDRHSTHSTPLETSSAYDGDDRLSLNEAVYDDCVPRPRASASRAQGALAQPRSPEAFSTKLADMPVVTEAVRAQAAIVAGRQAPTWAAGLRWLLTFGLVVALHVGVAVYLLRPVPEVQDGNPSDVVTVDLTPEPTTENTTPDDVPGPKVVESTAATSELTQAEDPDPPAPDSAPPTEAKRKPDSAPQAMAPPSPTEAEAVLPPMEKKLDDRPPDPKPIEKMPEVKEDTVERQTAPSQASTGSAALLGGGRRPSAAAQATWKGEIGTHLVHHRRYPQEARTNGWQGSARVRVTIDENGHVVRSELLKGTGRPLLDGEALALMQRSDPFPKPPTGMAVPVVLTVPVNFSIH